MKIALIGTDHMSESLATVFERMGSEISSTEECDVCWIAIDTPVTKNGYGKVKPILRVVRDAKRKQRQAVLFVVSSQIPVGTSKQIQRILGDEYGYAYMPELMRVGTGVDDFMDLPEVVIGVDGESLKPKLRRIFRDKPVTFTSVATAEVIKHANNAFLATSLSFIYDIADLCEAVGADVTHVATALRSDYRIGPEAYLDASAGFSGGHLERDLDYLQRVARVKGINLPVINAVMRKNVNRRKIVIDSLGEVKGEKVAFWGVSYKPGVSQSNNSLPSKLMRDIDKLGGRYSFCDPQFDNTDPYDCVKNAKAIICITPWSELKDLDFKRVAELMTGEKILFDARNYFAVMEVEIKAAGIKYIGVGR